MSLTRPRVPIHRMGDAALHLDLFEQPGKKRVLQHPVRGKEDPERLGGRILQGAQGAIKVAPVDDSENRIRNRAVGEDDPEVRQLASGVWRRTSRGA